MMRIAVIADDGGSLWTDSQTIKLTIGLLYESYSMDLPNSVAHVAIVFGIGYDRTAEEPINPWLQHGLNTGAAL